MIQGSLSNLIDAANFISDLPTSIISDHEASESSLSHKTNISEPDEQAFSEGLSNLLEAANLLEADPTEASALSIISDPEALESLSQSKSISEQVFSEDFFTTRQNPINYELNPSTSEEFLSNRYKIINFDKHCGELFVEIFIFELLNRNLPKSYEKYINNAGGLPFNFWSNYVIDIYCEGIEITNSTSTSSTSSSKYNLNRKKNKVILRLVFGLVAVFNSIKLDEVENGVDALKFAIRTKNFNGFSLFNTLACCKDAYLIKIHKAFYNCLRPLIFCIKMVRKPYKGSQKTFPNTPQQDLKDKEFIDAANKIFIDSVNYVTLWERKWDPDEVDSDEDKKKRVQKRKREEQPSEKKKKKKRTTRKKKKGGRGGGGSKKSKTILARLKPKIKNKPILKKTTKAISFNSEEISIFDYITQNDAEFKTLDVYSSNKIYQNEILKRKKHWISLKNQIKEETKLEEYELDYIGKYIKITDILIYASCNLSHNLDTILVDNEDNETAETIVKCIVSSNKKISKQRFQKINNLFYCCNNNNSDFPEFKIKIYTDAITEYKEELDYVNALYFLQNTTSEDEDVNEDEDADMDNMFYKKMFSYLNNLENVYAARDHDAANLLWNHYERENKYITVFTFDGFIKYPNGAMIVRDSFFQI
jgi:hypothetical protein